MKIRHGKRDDHDNDDNVNNENGYIVQTRRGRWPVGEIAAWGGGKGRGCLWHTQVIMIMVVIMNMVMTMIMVGTMRTVMMIIKMPEKLPSWATHSSDNDHDHCDSHDNNVEEFWKALKNFEECQRMSNNVKECQRVLKYDEECWRKNDHYVGDEVANQGVQLHQPHKLLNLQLTLQLWLIWYHLAPISSWLLISNFCDL